jgi:hypothetical protein
MEGTPCNRSYVRYLLTTTPSTANRTQPRPHHPDLIANGLLEIYRECAINSSWVGVGFEVRGGEEMLSLSHSPDERTPGQLV